MIIIDTFSGCGASGLQDTSTDHTCRTLISTEVWPSAAVEKVSLLEVGRVVFRVMSFVMTPPSVSRPSERGVTSNSTRLETCRSSNGMSCQQTEMVQLVSETGMRRGGGSWSGVGTQSA